MMTPILENAYLVLSVNDCKALLATARRSQKAARTSRGAHCIVLKNLRVLKASDGEHQISSATIALASREICEKATARMASDVRAESLSSTLAESVREVVGIEG